MFEKSRMPWRIRTSQGARRPTAIPAFASDLPRDPEEATSVHAFFFPLLPLFLL